MTSDTKRILMAAGFVLAAVFCIGYYTGEAVVEAGTTGLSALRIQPTADDTTAFRVDDTTGTSMFSIDNAGAITIAGSFGATTYSGSPSVTTASTASYAGTGVAWEGTADAFEGQLVYGNVTADYSWTFAAAGSFLVAGATLADPATVSTASYGNNGFTVEGTADASESSFTVTDPTSDNTLVWSAVGNLTSSATYIATGAGLADPVTASTASYGGTSVVYEGATADGNESSFSVADATGDNTLVWSAVGNLTSSATFIATGAGLADPVTASTASYGGTSVVYEGAAADGFESTLSVTDPTADNTLVWGADGTLTSSVTYVATGAGLADPVTASTASYGGTSIVVEGATADGFETSVVFADATADSALNIGAAGQVTSTADSLGWTYATGANAVCTTTCGAAAAVFGVDLAAGASAPVIVGPADATADACVCAG